MLERAALPDSFLITPAVELHGLVQSDLLLQGVRLRSGGSAPIDLLRVELGLGAAGRPVQQVVYSTEALADRLALLRSDVEHLTGWSAQLVLGRERFWDVDRLAGSTTLGAGAGGAAAVTHPGGVHGGLGRVTAERRTHGHRPSSPRPGTVTRVR